MSLYVRMFGKSKAATVIKGQNSTKYIFDFIMKVFALDFKVS